MHSVDFRAQDNVFSHALDSFFSALAFGGWGLEVNRGKDSPQVAFMICLTSLSMFSLFLWLAFFFLSGVIVQIPGFSQAFVVVF